MSFYGSGWKTALDLDFTAQTSQGITTDGSYTIGGYSFTKINSANEVTHLQLTNGTGLVFVPNNSSTDYYSGTISLPAVRLSLSSVIKNFSYGMPLRIYVYNSANNSSAEYDQATIAVESSGVSATNYNYVFKRGYNNNNAFGYITTMNINGGNQGQQNEQSYTTDNVMVLEISRGLPAIEFRTFTGTYSGGWPALTALNPHTIYTVGIQNPTTSISTASNWTVLLGAGRVNSGTALTITYARLRIDYKDA